MDINLKENLKSLRQKKKITQEALAEYLGITQQSVGKWERGEGFPDITLLPKIALYFNVSIDDLLSVGQARNEARINEYSKEAEIFEKSGDIDKRIALWENALNEFPNNLYVMEKLKTALAVSCPYPYKGEKAERIISLATRILSETTDIKLRESAIFSLFTVYCAWGDTDKALAYADMCGSMYYCRESMRAEALQGEDGIKASQICILNYLFCASQEAIKITNDHNSVKDEIRSIQFSIDILNLLFSDGNFGGYAADMSWRYSLLARAHASEKNKNKTYEALEKCVKFAIMDAENKQGRYTAPMVNRLEYGKNLSKNFKGNACNIRLRDLLLWHFDFIREEQEFKEYVKKLEDHMERK